MHSLKFTWCNMINNSSLKKFNRLSQKQLDNQFVNELISGLSCSPFEASAILDTVYKVYSLYFQYNGSIKPGQIIFHVVSIDSPPNLTLANCKQIAVILTFNNPTEDLPIREKQGVIDLRRHRIQRVCNEAFQQG
ncbi:MAG: DUF1670 domain-containing protein, partial [Bacteroidetes bacterium]|nr:DUF1670 domain-containing protein [Bacteroidota bacterium]